MCASIHISTYPLVAILDFEELNYTFPEGSIGSVCVSIVNPVILDVAFTLLTGFFGMFGDSHTQ